MIVAEVHGLHLLHYQRSCLVLRRKLTLRASSVALSSSIHRRSA